jgi:hypothetical protein
MNGLFNVQTNAKVISYAGDTVILISNKNIDPLYETTISHKTSDEVD